MKIVKDIHDRSLQMSNQSDEECSLKDETLNSHELLTPSINKDCKQMQLAMYRRGLEREESSTKKKTKKVFIEDRFEKLNIKDEKDES
jgi:hypothetical protein